MSSLAGKHILVTRAAGQFAPVAELARARGAVAESFPCLEVQCLPDNIREGLSSVADDACILLTSVNAVHCVASALDGQLSELFTGRSLVAVGPQTAAALAEYGLKPGWVADNPSQEGLVAGFTARGVPSEVCFLRAEQGRDAVQKALRDAGARVQTVHAYRTVCPHDDASAVIRMLKNNAVDAVLLGSSRCALHYVQRIGDAALADRPAVAVISPQVARAAEKAGLHVQCVAKETSFAGMLDALAQYFAGR